MMRTSVFAAALALAPLLAAAQQATVAAPGTGPASAQPNQHPDPAISERAENLSSHMVRDLHLNGYQADRTRQLNLDYTTHLSAIEREQARNPTEAARQTAALNQAREKAFQDLFSTDQFTDYFDARQRYAQLDQNYAHNASASILQNAIQNPAPVRANNATIGPAKAGSNRNRAAVRQ